MLLSILLQAAAGAGLGKLGAALGVSYGSNRPSARSIR